MAEEAGVAEEEEAEAAGAAGVPERSELLMNDPGRLVLYGTRFLRLQSVQSIPTSCPRTCATTSVPHRPFPSSYTTIPAKRAS